MARPSKLSDSDIDLWLEDHPGWRRETVAPGRDALVRTYTLDDFAAALGLVVRVGCAAEKRDHHPDVELGWGRVRLIWTTHDAGGITSLDTELAAASDVMAATTGTR